MQRAALITRRFAHVPPSPLVYPDDNLCPCRLTPSILSPVPFPSQAVWEADRKAKVAEREVQRLRAQLRQVERDQRED